MWSENNTVSILSVGVWLRICNGSRILKYNYYFLTTLYITLRRFLLCHSMISKFILNFFLQSPKIRGKHNIILTHLLFTKHLEILSPEQLVFGLFLCSVLKKYPGCVPKFRWCLLPPYLLREGFQKKLKNYGKFYEGF